MKPLALAAVAAALFASSASAMTPETEQYLRSIGLDPASQDIAAVDAEGPLSTNYDGDAEEFSLDVLASQKKKNGINSYIGTRTFIRGLKKNFAGTPIPKTNYDPMYLTPEERGLVGRKFAQPMMMAKKN